MNPKLSPLSTDETLFFKVSSETTDEEYDTWFDKDHKWICTCPDYHYRKHFCKHMRACAEMIGIKDTTVYAEVIA